MFPFLINTLKTDRIPLKKVLLLVNNEKITQNQVPNEE